MQAVTKKPYTDALRELVYTPLELAQTSLPTGPELPAPFIHGYDREGTSAPVDISESFASGWAWASGGIISTPDDLNRFIRGYVGGKLFGTKVQKKQRAFIPGGSEPPGPGLNAAGWRSTDTRRAAGRCTATVAIRSASRSTQQRTRTGAAR